MSDGAGDQAMRWEGRAVRADAVAGRLLDLRHIASDEEGFPLARASVMNLIVYVERQSQVKPAVREVDELAVRHPSRAVVVAPEPGTRFSLDAEVILRRHPLATHGLVFERVLLRPRGASPEGLDTLVIPLLIPHLQSFLWWLSDPDPADPALQSLMSICDRLIVDSSLGRAERLGALATLLVGAPRLKRGDTGLPRLVLGDLAWTRLESFRSALARVFDEGGRAEYLPGLESVEIVGSRGQSSPPTPSELLFAGWIGSRLGYARPMPARGGVSLQAEATGRRTLFTFIGREAHTRTSAPDLHPLHAFKLVASRGRRRLEAGFRADGGSGHLLLQEGKTKRIDRTQPQPALEETEVLSRELARFGRDTIYEESLAMGARIEAVLPTPD